MRSTPTTRVLALRIPADLHARLRELSIRRGGLRAMLESRLAALADEIAAEDSPQEEDRQAVSALAAPDERDREGSRPSQSVA